MERGITRGKGNWPPSGEDRARTVFLFEFSSIGSTPLRSMGVQANRRALRISGSEHGLRPDWTVEVRPPRLPEYHLGPLGRGAAQGVRAVLCVRGQFTYQS